MSMQPPKEIKLLQKQKVVQVTFANGTAHNFSCYFLRCHSPSAEMRGHGQQKPDVQAIDPQVNILSIEPVGNYAVKLVFDDGHQSGLFSWQTLYELVTQDSVQ